MMFLLKARRPDEYRENIKIRHEHSIVTASAPHSLASRTSPTGRHLVKARPAAVAQGASHCTPTSPDDGLQRSEGDLAMLRPDGLFAERLATRPNVRAREF